MSMREPKSNAKPLAKLRMCYLHTSVSETLSNILFTSPAGSKKDVYPSIRCFFDYTPRKQNFI